MIKCRFSYRWLTGVVNIVVALVLGFIFISPSTHAQSATATLSGTVEDEKGSVVPNAEITIFNPSTAQRRQATTNSEGYFTITFLPPGSYTIKAKREGFALVEIRDVVLNVNDQREIKIQLKVGQVGETIDVIAGASLTRTDTAVGTVVDRQFVENLPLNGRSFQSLITLTPGVVLTKASIGEQGQFSVNGQRANTNYFMVDGVSANVGVSGGGALGQSASGSLPGLTAFGGTNNLVSVDALQEFKILTSTYAPEFGRTPGAQVSLVTRSGTNEFRGSLFEYFRNDLLDARDWFANRNNTSFALRQNDFGGVLGGPIIKNRTFFFFSYEGLRLRLPQSKTVVVPSVSARQSAPAALQPILNAYPVPNGRIFINGLAEFVAGYSDPLKSDAASIRLDHVINHRLTIFGRYNHASSESVQRSNSLSNLTSSRFKTQTFTTGLIHNISTSTINDLKFNYSRSTGSSFFLLDNLGGATPLADSILFPPFTSSDKSNVLVQISGAASLSVGRSGDNLQQQFNLIDNLSVIIGSHQLKFGLDYRRLAPTSGVAESGQFARFSGIGVTPPGVAPPAGSVMSGKASSVVVTARDSIESLFVNFSAYGQDTWQATSRLTLTYGMRWEVNPPPKGRDGKELFTLALAGDPSAVILSPAGAPLAPQGTPLYETTYNNFAPRAGIAYQLSRQKGREIVLRGGFGVFYDLGNGAGLYANSVFPYLRSKNLFGITFPLTDPILAQPPSFSLTPSGNSIFVFDRKLKLPITYQWNVAMEQSLGSNQTMSASYVGAAGRRLLRQEQLLNSNPAATFGFVQLYRNGATSDYHALQLQFQRRLSKGLQALASYTFSKSLDSASNDSVLLTPSERIDPRQDRGPSDFDVRHVLSAATTYNLPALTTNEVGGAILHNWSVDVIATARSATPVNVSMQRDLGPGIGIVSARPDLILGVPLYLDDLTAPGGKRFNRTPVMTATGQRQIGPFLIPTAQRQGTLGRNALRGFSVYQVDLALRRQFRLTERVNLQFRAEAFNLFNNPNFGDPLGDLSTPLFGESIQSFGRSLGSGGTGGGLSPIYQVGGSRSLQLALRLQF
jgi:hypothetical protein